MEDFASRALFDKMKSDTATLQRLLCAYELLTREEATVLGEENFLALPELQARKEAVFTALRDALEAVGSGRLSGELRERFRAVIETGSASAARLARALQKARAARETLGAAEQRLRALGQTYGGKSARNSASGTFCALS